MRRSLIQRPFVAVLLTCLGTAAYAQDTQQAELNRACEEALAVELDFQKPGDYDMVATAFVEACKRAAQANPDDAGAQRRYAEALLRSRRIADAMEVLQPLAQKGDANAAYMIFDTYVTVE